MPNLAQWVTPHPTVGKSSEVLRKETEDALDDIIQGLTKVSETAVKERGAGATTIEIKGTDYFNAFEKFNYYFLKERWGDGLPLFPPTREKVDWMLTGTDRAPGEVVVKTRPSGRAATVEAIAINAVMAGAIPAYLPVIITALEAWDECAWGWGSVTTTSPAAPLVVVNGPIAKQLDINSKSNATGYGWRANTSIGRTIELVFNTIGGTVPGYTDMSIMGCSSTITSTVMAENEDVLTDIGWKAYAELQGFKKDANVLSIVPAFWGFKEIWIKANSAEDLLECLIWELDNKGREGLMDWVGGTWLFLCPEHAQILAQDGWSKEKVMDYLSSTLPRYYCFPKGKLRTIFKEAYARATEITKMMPDNVLISGYSSEASDYKIFVVGGAGNESQNWGVGAPFHPDFVSREIKVPRNWGEILEKSEIITMSMPKLPW